MQKDPKYDEMLCKYDFVGPKIADALRENFQNEPDAEMIVGLFNFGIQSTARLIEEGNYDEAVSQYTMMTQSLEEHYCISIENVTPNDHDYTQDGHSIKLGTYPKPANI